MGESYKDSSLKIFSLNGNLPLAENIAKVFGTELGKSKVTQFSDGEIAITSGDGRGRPRLCLTTVALVTITGAWRTGPNPCPCP